VFFHLLCRNAGYDLGAERLYTRRAEFIAARFHGHAVGDRYKRLTALLADTVDVRPSLELTAREPSWAQRLHQEAEQNTDLLRRVQSQTRREDGPGFEL
jgi:cell filamentation protein